MLLVGIKTIKRKAKKKENNTQTSVHVKSEEKINPNTLNQLYQTKCS